ncbi:NAD-dependent epimerase/dehydratase family protein [Planctomicrobium sp. SH664]|uniref:NAD-dependent epimerase/dehydratase family protein n=1 Tax=Planctomicrobium sp. SH664 TaxID=3448125 RepID=UPI003F5C9E72
MPALPTLSIPATIDSVEQLDDLLSLPSEAAVAAMGRMQGDLLLLGIGGKMGPTLARMAVRASEMAGVRRRVIGVSRFSSPELPAELNRWGVETISCDLGDENAVRALPDVENVIFMAGMKFGSSGNQPLTWMMNVEVPVMVCRKFARSRIVAFSSGNIYGLSPAVQGGSREEDPLAPVGEYAMSIVGRERMFQHFSQALGIPTLLLRLNYATELRYGVLVDLALTIWNEQPIDLSMGTLNSIWQGDANAATLAAFDHVDSPARILNLAGPELLSVRRIAEELGQLLGKTPKLHGTEAPDAILSNGQRGQQLWGYPRVGPSQMLSWIAHWVRTGGRLHNKPTHFESREGKF